MASIEKFELKDWSSAFSAATQVRAADALENGSVLFFPELGFSPNQAERAVFSAHLARGDRKNITLDPVTGSCHGSTLEDEQQATLEALMQRFSDAATNLVRNLIPAYGPHMERARATFRPVEIAGRSYSPKKDDRLLHVDAFPSRPTRGRRILRLFTNVNPEGHSRVWRVGESFEDFAATFLPKLRPPNPLQAWLLSKVGITKGKHHEYQQSAPYEEIAFPAQSTWICFTDQVLHAALSGQFALEQTFHLDVAHMIDKRRAPIKILERMVGMELV